MGYWRDVNPSGAVSDFVELFRDAGPRRWPTALAAALVTAGMIGTMAQENWKKPRALPTITYITSWPADRTEAETKAFIAQNQRIKDAEEAQQAASDAEGQKLWMAVGKASGLDVDKMKQKADADRAKEAAAAAEREKQLLKNVKVEPVGK